MKKYKVKEEYNDCWGNDIPENGEIIVDDAEIERLAKEWECTIEELMEQVEEINPKMDRLAAYTKASRKMNECKEDLVRVIVKLGQAEQAMMDAGKNIIDETEPIYKLVAKANLEATKLEQMYEAMARVYEMMEETK